VASSSDYPGCLVAAAIARELGLPGPDPAALLRCSHKLYSRLAQREAVPEATPAFEVIDGPAGIPFPLFVKPVKSWFSVFARRVDAEAELARFLADPALRHFLANFTRPFNQLLRRYTDLALDASHMLAEQCLGGDQVTVEGFVSGGEVTVMGVSDSVMHRGTISFQRFDYPSQLPARTQARLGEIAARAVLGLGLDQCLFNVELFVDGPWIIEVNPRMVGQFADLHEKVDGTNTFELLLQLATGGRPTFRPGRGRYAAAASFPQRVFANERLLRNPSAADIAAVQARFPDTIVKSYLVEGQRAGDPGDDQNDLGSYLYSMINMGASDLPTLLTAHDEARRLLGFRFG